MSTTPDPNPTPPLAAIADFLEHTARGLQALAADLRPPEAAQTRSESALNPEDLGLGSRQREIVALPELATERGMTTGEVAKATGQTDAANTHTALQALAKRGVLEHLADERPARWRLAPSLRGVSDPYLAMAGHVRAGEWTTYGDISIAVRGDTKAARAVGRAAATLDHFPNPHRVLWSGGRIPPNWRSAASADPNPEECRRRLEAEGIRFDPVNDTANRDQYVSWDVLKERDEQQ